MKRIKGEQMYLFMGQGTLLPVGASTDCSVNMSAETIEVSVRGQGRWRRFRPGKKMWTISCGGFYFDQPGVPTSFMEGADLIGETVRVAITILARNLVNAGLVLGSITPDAEMTLVGDATITACDYSGSVGGLSTYNISIQGSGDLSQIS